MRILFLDDRTKRIEAAQEMYGVEFDLTCVFNVKECLRYMNDEDWDIISLDADLNGDDFVNPKSWDSALAIVEEIEMLGWPTSKPKPEFMIHSSNVFAANNMAYRLQALHFKVATARFVYPTKRYKVGLVAGCFDILHPGYIQMFKEAKSVCKKLVVALQKDPSQDRPDKIKPIFNVLERSTTLEALRYVDQVFIYQTEEELVELIKGQKVDVRILGSDYMDEKKKVTGEDIAPSTYYVDRRNHPWSATYVRQMLKKQDQ